MHEWQADHKAASRSANFILCLMESSLRVRLLQNLFTFLSW